MIQKLIAGTAALCLVVSLGIFMFELLARPAGYSHVAAGAGLVMIVASATLNRMRSS
jgi:hypothetical protein